MFRQYVFYEKNSNRHFINVGRKYFIHNIYTVLEYLVAIKTAFHY